MSTPNDNNKENPNFPRGANNGPLYEPDNDFVYNDIGTVERVEKGPSNHYIVFGRDRMGPPGEDTGYGSKGDTKCASIDIVVGRMGPMDASKMTEIDPAGNIVKTRVNSSPTADAARIYISQKTDIDKMFSLAEGIGTMPAIAKSAILMKADEIRVVSRGNLKLITRADKNYANPINNRPVGTVEITGVQLIGNNNAKPQDMQPIPKGKNLADLLQEIIIRILKINGTVLSFMKAQNEVNLALMNHDHISMYPGTVTSPSGQALNKILDYIIKEIMDLEPAMMKHTNNLISTQSKFLLSTSARYINSTYHYLN